MPCSPIDAEHREGRRVVVDFVGHPRTEVLRHAHHLGMRAVGRHAVAEREPSTPCADLDHRADIAVAERQRLIELAADRFERRRTGRRCGPCRAPSSPSPAAGAPCRSARRGRNRPASARCRPRPACATVAISSVPGATSGAGTSANAVEPSLRFCRTCFTRPLLRGLDQHEQPVARQQPADQPARPQCPGDRQ